MGNNSNNQYPESYYDHAFDKIDELNTEIKDLQKEYDRLDNGANCDRQFAITREIEEKQSEINKFFKP